MNNMDFIRGTVVGMIAGATIGMAAVPKKKSSDMKSMAGKALRAAGDIVENISDAMGMQQNIFFSAHVGKENDVLMVGRESAGVPDEIHNVVDGRVLIPMKNDARCLNVDVSLAVVTGEALRQCELF